MHRLVAKILLLVLTFSAPALLKGQDSASITGVVTDQTGAVVPGVSVELLNTATNTTYQGVTNSLGSYTISHAAPGPGYKITFTGDGFRPVVMTDL